ncbi:MAG: ferrous iron transport protein B, partial [Muribaculaceae bacterium]|nr:ferrous iron transport protein B [Muribaculaceae bacterium]
IKPCGFEWREGVSIMAGVGAKEIVASTMAVLFSQSGEDAEDFNFEGADINGSAKLSHQIATSGITPLAAFGFVIFVLLYMPCIPSCIAIKNESGKWKWALFAAIYTTTLAWICAFLIFQVGSLLKIGV